MAKKKVTEFKGFDIAKFMAMCTEVMARIKAILDVCENWEDYAEKILHIDPKKIEKHPTLKRFREIWGIAFSENMSGKLKEVLALTTCCLVNPICLKRMLAGWSVCAHCFAAATEMRYGELRENSINNTVILNSVVIPDKFWPILPTDMLRFEPFGDAVTWRQHANYFECAKANKHVKCALWSKNPWITAEAIAHGYKKPKNVIYIYSSPKLNTPEEIEELFRKYPFIDKIFTVYEEEFIKENNIDINCGGRSCRGCKRCYSKRTAVYVREQVK